VRSHRYDFNKPEQLPSDLLNTFDMVVIDPPFITRDVWEKYSHAAKLLLHDTGMIAPALICVMVSTAKIN
jgi:16S rRNA G966 N2-methylase RsmD